MIQIKRIYEEPSDNDGQRILADRLWPRGISKDKAKLDDWLKDIAPSDELRHWFDHDPAKWSEFQARFTAELDANPATKELIDRVKSHAGTTTLLYAAHDEEHNNAVVLQSWLERHQ